MKIKDLYPKNLKKVNDFFKNASEKLNSYVATRNKFSDSTLNIDVKVDGDVLGNIKVGNLEWKWIDSLDVECVCKFGDNMNTEDLNKVVDNFLKQVFSAIVYLRCTCKSYLTMKRSENKESDRVNSKSLSEALLKLKKAVEENLGCQSMSFNNSSTIEIKNKQVKGAEVIKKEIRGEINGCEKTLSLFSGGKRINSFGKYFNKSDFKKFKLTLNNLENYLDILKMKVAQI